MAAELEAYQCGHLISSSSHFDDTGMRTAIATIATISSSSSSTSTAQPPLTFPSPSLSLTSRHSSLEDSSNNFCSPSCHISDKYRDKDSDKDTFVVTLSPASIVCADESTNSVLISSLTTKEHDIVFLPANPASLDSYARVKIPTEISNGDNDENDEMAYFPTSTPSSSSALNLDKNSFYHHRVPSIPIPFPIFAGPSQEEEFSNAQFEKLDETSSRSEVQREDAVLRSNKTHVATLARGDCAELVLGIDTENRSNFELPRGGKSESESDFVEVDKALVLDLDMILVANGDSDVKLKREVDEDDDSHCTITISSVSERRRRSSGSGKMRGKSNSSTPQNSPRENHGCATPTNESGYNYNSSSIDGSGRLYKVDSALELALLKGLDDIVSSSNNFDTSNSNSNGNSNKTWMSQSEKVSSPSRYSAPSLSLSKLLQQPPSSQSPTPPHHHLMDGSPVSKHYLKSSSFSTPSRSDTFMDLNVNTSSPKDVFVYDAPGRSNVDYYSASSSSPHGHLMSPTSSSSSPLSSSSSSTSAAAAAERSGRRPSALQLLMAWTKGSSPTSPKHIFKRKPVDTPWGMEIRFLQEAKSTTDVRDILARMKPILSILDLKDRIRFCWPKFFSTVKELKVSSTIWTSDLQLEVNDIINNYFSANPFFRSPEDIVQEILKFLPPKDIAKVASVSHAFNTMTKANGLWMDFYKRRFPNDLDLIKFTPAYRGDSIPDDFYVQAYLHRLMFPRVMDKVEVSWSGKFRLAESVDIYHGNAWWQAEIVDKFEATNQFKVHYPGWDVRWDEWIPRHRLRWVSTPDSSDIERISVGDNVELWCCGAHVPGTWLESKVVSLRNKRYCVMSTVSTGSTSFWVEKDRIRPTRVSFTVIKLPKPEDSSLTSSSNNNSRNGNNNGNSNNSNPNPKSCTIM